MRLVVTLVLLLAGCSLFHGPAPLTSSESVEGVVRTVYKHDWMTTLSWIAVFGGVAAMFAGHFRFVPLIGFGITMLGIIQAYIRFSWWLGLGGAIGAAALVAYVVITTTRANQDLVKGVQSVKDGLSAVDRAGVNSVLHDNQHPVTAKLVKAIKKGVKV